jgi:hypothetical protein
MTGVPSGRPTTARAQYAFNIEDRRYLGGHVVYVIGYRPRSNVIVSTDR